MWTLAKKLKLSKENSLKFYVLSHKTFYLYFMEVFWDFIYNGNFFSCAHQMFPLIFSSSRFICIRVVKYVSLRFKTLNFSFLPIPVISNKFHDLSFGVYCLRDLKSEIYTYFRGFCRFFRLAFLHKLVKKFKTRSFESVELNWTPRRWNFSLWKLLF